MPAVFPACLPALSSYFPGSQPRLSWGSTRPACADFGLSQRSFHVVRAVFSGSHSHATFSESGRQFPRPSGPSFQAGTRYAEAFLGHKLASALSICAYQNRMFWHTRFSHFGALSSMVTGAPWRDANLSSMQTQYMYFNMNLISFKYVLNCF